MHQGFEELTDMRAEANPSKRLEIAETAKVEANGQLSDAPGKALKAYLVGIWLLMRGNPPPTRSLVAPVAVERDALISLGSGSRGIPLTDAEAFGETYAAQVGE